MKTVISKPMAYIVAGTQVALALLAFAFVYDTWTSLSIVFLIGVVQVLLALVFGALMKRMPRNAKRIGQTYFIGLAAFMVMLMLLRLGIPKGLYNLIAWTIAGLTPVLYLLMLVWTLFLGHVKFKTN